MSNIESSKYLNLKSLAGMWDFIPTEFGDTLALQDPHSKPELKLSYQELHSKIRQFATALQGLGIEKGNKICLFADNSPRWLMADQGIIMAGAVDAVRSSGAEKN